MDYHAFTLTEKSVVKRLRTKLYIFKNTQADKNWKSLKGMLAYGILEQQKPV